MIKYTRIPLKLQDVAKPKLYHLPLLYELLGKHNRWQGQTIKDYTVLQHTVLGAHLCEAHAPADDKLKKFFVLHDVEEAAFMGDIRTLFKKAFTTDEYKATKRSFNRALHMQLNLPNFADYKEQVKLIDMTLLAAEYTTITCEYVEMDDVIAEALDKAVPELFKFACRALRTNSFISNEAARETHSLEEHCLNVLGIPPWITPELWAEAQARVRSDDPKAEKPSGIFVEGTLEAEMATELEAKLAANPTEPVAPPVNAATNSNTNSNNG